MRSTILLLATMATLLVAVTLVLPRLRTLSAPTAIQIRAARTFQWKNPGRHFFS